MQRAVTQYHARDNLLEQVRLEIQKRLQQGVPQLEPIADQLGINPGPCADNYGPRTPIFPACWKMNAAACLRLAAAQRTFR